MGFRDVDIAVDLQKVVSVEDVATKEEIISITQSFEQKNIIVETRLYNSEGAVVRDNTKVITGELYENLNNGTFFDEKSVWETLDTIDSENDK